jgi:ectoine hydroxylase-related dioxygenase (phytanoyl-CoA dioxygenase family)
VVDHAVAARGDRRFSFSTEDGSAAAVARDTADDQEYYDRVFTQRVNLWQTDSAFRELLFQKELGQFVAGMAGVSGLRVWHDQALIKQAYANPTAFHLDVPYWSFTSPDAITIWVALDDATLENGCLYYMPGSHKAQKFDNVEIGKEIGALFDIYPEWRDVQATPCPVRAGGALLHNGLTFHGAGANMTPGRRRAITCAYMPDGSTFNGIPNVLPREYLNTLAIGDLLDNKAHNPLVFGPASGQ